jgi:hypothetical protein
LLPKGHRSFHLAKLCRDLEIPSSYTKYQITDLGVDLYQYPRLA